MEPASIAAAPVGTRRSARLLRRASDERLVALVRAGEDSAFAALYDRHHGPIFGFCRHMLGSREEAEDALQQTFLSAYRDLMASTKPIELRPWLFAIARNRCLSLLRARREHVALDLAEPATDGLAATVERREDLRELLGDLARLPEDQRAALLLAELGALDHAGIARVLGCPREKVKALVFQARSSLAASREARATPCEQIRVELATATGGALRRGPLRRHLRACAGCRTFKAEVSAQRGLLALALPVAPSAALKAGVLSSLGIGGHGGAASAGATGGALGGLLASSPAAKVAVSLAVAGAVAGGSEIAIHHHAPAPAHASHAPDLAGAHMASQRPRLSMAATGDRVVVSRTGTRDARKHSGAGVPTLTRPADAGPLSPIVAPAAPSLPGDERQSTGDKTTPPAAQGGTPPGQSGAAPGQGGATHGATPPRQGGTPPGQIGTNPGQGGNSQGGSGSSSGNGGNAPGHNGTPSGQGGTPPGHSGTAPSASGNAPGHGRTPPGQSHTHGQD